MASDPHGDPQTGGNAEALPVQDCGVIWAAFSRDALAHAAAGATQKAAALWFAASEIALQLSSADPRRACSLQNLATLHALSGERPRTKALFAEAQVAWERSRQRLPASRSARSSMFHFRLEQHHGDALNSQARRRAAEYIDAGWAACALSARLVDLCHGTGGDAVALLPTALHANHPLARHMQQVAQKVRSGWPTGATLGVARVFPEWKTPRHQVQDRFQDLRAAAMLAAVLDIRMPA